MFVTGHPLRVIAGSTMDAGFLRRQAARALRLASQCTDAGIEQRLKLVAAELLEEAVALERAETMPAPHVIAQTRRDDDAAAR
jgi:hypothetical protein